MPWTAQLGGQVVDLRSTSSSDRVAMHDERPRFACRGCGGGMHLRVYDADAVVDPGRFAAFDDRTGPFVGFVHNAGAGRRCRLLGFHGDESVEHLAMKSRLAAAAARKGWAAELEVFHQLEDGTRCRADVVVHRAGEKTRVLEAQRAPLGSDEALRRTALYRKAFGPVLWTHTRQRPWSRRLPSLRVDDNDLGTVIGGVYLDQGGHKPLPAASIDDVLPRVLPPHRDLRWVWAADDFGYFCPLGGPAPARRARRRRRRSPRGTPQAGRFVRECPSLDDLDAPAGLYAPDGTPWCSFGPGFACTNGDRCLNPNHRAVPR